MIQLLSGTGVRQRLFERDSHQPESTLETGRAPLRLSLFSISRSGRHLNIRRFQRLTSFVVLRPKLVFHPLRLGFGHSVLRCIPESIWISLNTPIHRSVEERVARRVTQKFRIGRKQLDKHPSVQRIDLQRS